MLSTPAPPYATPAMYEECQKPPLQSGAFKLTHPSPGAGMTVRILGGSDVYGGMRGEVARASATTDRKKRGFETSRDEGLKRRRHYRLNI